jgi:hypothetical protein
MAAEQAAHTAGIFEDHAAAEEPHTRNDVRINLCLTTRGIADHEGADDKSRGSGSDQSVGARPGHALPPLPLEADSGAHEECRAQSKGEIQNA